MTRRQRFPPTAASCSWSTPTTGTLLPGDLPPIQGAVVAMHTAMYAGNPMPADCVLHTHSP